MTSGDLIPSDRDRPEQASLEVEFALVVARMIDSLKDNPEDTRQAIYELARYKLQEQLPDVTDKDKKRTQQAWKPLSVALKHSRSRTLTFLPRHAARSSAVLGTLRPQVTVFIPS